MYQQMLHFLWRSRMFYAITATSAISYNNIAQFWSTAEHHCEIEPPAILATVAGYQIRITEDSIRTVLRFGDRAEYRTEFPLSLINGCFHRMGYVGNFNDSQLRKTNLSPVWRFLMHILIVCLSAWKVGLDGIGQSLQSAMVALVLNKPYCWVTRTSSGTIPVRSGSLNWMINPPESSNRVEYVLNKQEQ